MKMKALQLTWEKQSYQRYRARCGPVRVEVRRVGFTDLDARWVVDEVLGQRFHDSARYPRTKNGTLVEAQLQAEQVAEDMIAALRFSPLGDEAPVKCRRHGKSRA